jgi:hypothetical protein
MYRSGKEVAKVTIRSIIIGIGLGLVLSALVVFV